jgi:hypothetical protein
MAIDASLLGKWRVAQHAESLWATLWRIAEPSRKARKQARLTASRLPDYGFPGARIHAVSPNWLLTA